MQPIYQTHEIRDLEARATIAPGEPTLMQRAGLAAATFAKDTLLNGKKKVLVLCGPGNNGGDGFVLATHFRHWRLDVSALFLGEEKKLSTDARGALMGWRADGGMVFSEPPRDPGWDLIVDALFGIGLEREITGRYAELIQFINQHKCPRFALDIPSGINSDSGQIMGIAVDATHTMTFIGLKPGLLTLDGPDHVGQLVVDKLGLDPESVRPARGHATDESLLSNLVPARKRNVHKGSFGSLGIIGGATGMTGAALLSGRAALKLGTGRVYVGLLGEDAPSFDPLCPELMLRNADQIAELPQLTALAIGPGLGKSDSAADLLGRSLFYELPVVIDADALNLIATDTALGDQCRERMAPTILTPHPAEAARLLNASSTEVQRDRVPVAITLAKDFNAYVVLKGAGSVCALPDGRWFINQSGNPGLASAGMGDVLTGMIGALIAQGMEADTALTGAVYLHGKAADTLVSSGLGPIGLTASETIDAARDLLNKFNH
jgi:hydroxyethylthiazole kinase-like uncharacterized protein yjeF